MQAHDLEKFERQVAEMLPQPGDAVLGALTPSGTLRAGINLSNFLLVTGKSNDGAPEGVSPSVARILAKVLGCGVELVTFDSPGAVADAAKTDAWDIGNIGADPARADFITFTSAYCEIESTCLVRDASQIATCADVDRPTVKIATKKRAAYTLWLERHIKSAELIQFDSMDASFDAFVNDGLDVLAGLRPRLLEDSARVDGVSVLADKFAAVQQAIGTPSNRDPQGAAFLEEFVQAAKKSGLVQALIDFHGVSGKLSCAP